MFVPCLVPYVCQAFERNVERIPDFQANLEWFQQNREHLAGACVNSIDNETGRVHLLYLVNREQLVRILAAIWDPTEFRSEFGLRSLSKYHEQHPMVHAGQRVAYDPAESRTWLKGGTRIGEVQFGFRQHF